MSNEQSRPSADGDTIRPVERTTIWCWALSLIVLFVSVGVATVRHIYVNRVDSAARHDGRMNPHVGEGGRQALPNEVPMGASPVRVSAGIYLDRIVDLSVRDHAWTADFYVWFRWQGADIDPGSTFSIVDGSIESKEKEDDVVSGDEHYLVYRVVARITKFFDEARFPRDDHVLIISIEPTDADRDDWLFVPDEASSGISSRVEIAGYSIERNALIEKPHAYRSTLGDPRLPAGTEAIYSQLRMGVWIERSGWGFYVKLFVALYAAVGAAMLALFCFPASDIGTRLGLGIGSLGAAIGNMYITSMLVPDTGVLTLTDLVNHMGIGTILLCLVQSVISHQVFERWSHSASRLFDKVSVVLFFVWYLVINFALPFAA